MSLLDRFEEFHAAASAATGFDDFGDDSYREPMQAYLSEIDTVDSLGDMGKELIANSIIGLLCGRLRTFTGIKKYPDSQSMPIARPIFIIGLARTGTTVLHRLICHDPNIQHLPFWLASNPMPRPPVAEWRRHPVFQMTEIGLEQFAATMPGAMDIHPMLAEAPDECRYLIDQSGWSHTFFGTADLPKYQRWATNTDMTFAFEYYRKALQLIANGDSRRWVLKDVAHVFCLDAIFNVFPDACIIHTHRDPFDALASTSNLTWLIRRMREPGLTMADVGRHALKLWGEGLHKMEIARRKYNQSQFFDVHMLEAKKDPLGVMERIYAHFGQPLTKATRESWQHQVASDPSQSHSISNFDLANIGFTRAEVNTAVGEYYQRYAMVKKQ
ncbi:MAG: sulfotransferase [Porticoccaceae bacterium]|nr:sulfotransferase [Porticoccaceae bacterium]